jgi:pyruvate kinase
MTSIEIPRTKIVATIGPASRSPEILRKLIQAGMSVARLNFSHGSYEDHASMVTLIRQISEEMDTPITILQDLQGPKIRVCQLPGDVLELVPGNTVYLVPSQSQDDRPNAIPIDYPYLAEEAEVGAQVLLDDGLLELRVEAIAGDAVECQVIEGGPLKNRKGVNLPSLNLRLPSLTAKDQQDLQFGIAQGVDWVSLSFVRRAEDVRVLKQFLSDHGGDGIPVIAKIEKPQALEDLEAIVAECNGLMVARGDLGVEVSPEKVPMIQKQIVRLCNQQGVPTITATQMLDSMIHEARPTRAEASDVANAIIDGTDAVMLSGESAVGKYPVKAVAMMSKIARQVEPYIEFVNYPPPETDETHALTEALNTIDATLNLRCIVAFTSTGYTARIAAKERPRALVVAFTPNEQVYHRLNLVWGVKPILLDGEVESFEELIEQAESNLVNRDLATPGDKILILAGIPTRTPKGTNFLKIHTITLDSGTP